MSLIEWKKKPSTPVAEATALDAKVISLLNKSKRPLEGGAYSEERTPPLAEKNQLTYWPCDWPSDLAIWQFWT